MKQVITCAVLSLGVVLGGATFGTGEQRVNLGLPEVRQLVTFRFSERVPFGVRPSMDGLMELYRGAPAVLRVRGYREAESPEPFDLIVMTSYRGLEGFDQSREQLTHQRTRSGVTMPAAMRRIEELSDWHRDEFIEMLDDLDYRTSTTPEVYVFEWIRLVPAANRAYELLLQTVVLQWERDLTYLHLTETGRVMVGDGWDYVRVLGFLSLSAYHDYVRAWRDQGATEQLALHVAQRKVFMVREDDSLRVR